MKIKLNIIERLALLALLPARGTLEKLLLCERMSERLRFSEEERKKHDIVEMGEQIHIREHKDIKSENEYEFDENEYGYFKEVLVEKETKGELSLQNLSLYKKIVLEKDA